MNIPLTTSSFPSLFIQLVITLIIVYFSIAAVNYFANRKLDPNIQLNIDMISLFKLLGKILTWGGIGFIISDLIFMGLSASINNRNVFEGLTSGTPWKNLSFGIILLFIGIGLGQVRKSLIKNKTT